MAEDDVQDSSAIVEEESEVLYERSATLNLDQASNEIQNEDIDFLEKYVLSVDRIATTSKAFDDDALDYWYWSILNCQAREADEEQEEWIQRCLQTDFFPTDPIQSLMYRKSIIEDTVEEVQSKLEDIVVDVKLDHEKDHTVGQVDDTTFRDTLDINTNQLLTRMWSKVENGEDKLTNIFTSASGMWIAEKIRSKELRGSQCGDLLELMEDEPPKIPYLLTALQEDFKNGVRFGERKIHAKLTRDTLLLVGEKMPSLFTQEEFLATCLRKLRNVNDIHLGSDRRLLGDYLGKLLDFIRQNGRSHVSLTAIVLFNVLRFQEEEGMSYDESLLKEYLALPRTGNKYKPPPKVSKKRRNKRDPVIEYKEPTGGPSDVVTLDFSVLQVPELVPIGDDEPYVRRALTHFFLKKRKVKDFEKVVGPEYGNPLRAEVQLQAGHGDEKETADMINVIKSSWGAAAYKELRNRVTLEFVPSCKTLYKISDSVSIDIVSKNNPLIEVNVYRVNAKNYYKSMLAEIPNDINLSGSMPIASFNLTCDEPAIRTMNHSIDIPQLSGERGVFAIDITGNGVYLRSLIRKGELRYIADQDSQNNRGHVFKVFNEENQMIENTCIWMDGVEYHADENGDVCLPFAKGQSRSELIILEDAVETGSATLQHFQRMAPNFKLECGMYIDREQLRSKQTASVLIRANLYFNTEILSLSRLENVQLKLVCEDNMGQVRTRISPIVLDDNTETVYEFLVPTELRYVECLLTCQCEGVDLVAKQLLTVNIINDTMAIGDMYLFPSGAAGYILAVFGKNGEPLPAEVVDLKFTHRFFRDELCRTVQTDENGFAYLGKLRDIAQVDATSKSETIFSEESFDLLKDSVNFPRTVNRALNTTVRIPFIADNPRRPPTVEVYDKDYITCFSSCARYEGYFVIIEGLPAGDFVCHIRDAQNADIRLAVSDGMLLETGLGSYIVSQNRVLGLSEDHPLNIVDVSGSRGEGYKIKLHGINERTRVHLVAVVNNPCFNLFGFLSSPNSSPVHISFQEPTSVYLQSAELDSEYDYIINRKSTEQFVGNNLPRPSLGNRLWTAQNPPLRLKDPKPPKRAAAIASKMKQLNATGLDNFGLAAKRKEADSSSLEYLGVSSRVMFNLKPTSVNGVEGMIEIPKEFYANEHNLVQVLAVDDDDTALRNVILEESEADVKRTDVRLNPGLSSEKHYAETRKVICLSPGDEYVINDFSTAEYEPYETLQEPYNLFRAAAGSDRGTWLKFEPLIRWCNLAQDQKLEFYDKNACHEVNFFMCRKDPEFFKEVCVPQIQNKTQSSFMDDYLLGRSLSRYMTLHRYHRLNTFEKILICERLEDDGFKEKTLAWIREKAMLTDLDPRKLDEVFNMAIKSAQLGVEELDRQLAVVELSAIASARGPKDTGSLVEQVSSPDALRHADIFGAEEYISMTRQYGETTFYCVDSASQSPDLITPSRFWADYATYVISQKDSGFVSEWFQIATRNTNEMLLALGVLDVPLEADEPRREDLGNQAVKLTADVPVVLYLRELVETTKVNSAVAVSTNYFDPEDRQHIVDGDLQDKFITDGQFTTSRIFGCRVVVTNVSSVSQQVEVLCQIPTGAVPVGIQCFQTQCYLQDLPPFGTYRREFYFYWPEPGTYTHFPPHINKNGKTVGAGGGMDTVEVANVVVQRDTTSWRYIANLASEEEVLDFLENSPEAMNVNLEKICWRLNDPEFFTQVADILRKRRVFNHRVWAYSLVADTDGKALGEYLAWNPEFCEICGPHLQSKLVNIDLHAVREWQIMEFWPLLNARTHKFEMNFNDYKEYYYQFLRTLAFSTPDVDGIATKEKLVLCSYLLVRNKIDQALKLFNNIDVESTGDVAMIYDYFKVYFDFLTDGTQAAATARKYVDMTLPKTVKARFQAVLDSLAESKNPQLSDKYFLEEEEQRRAASEKPAISFEILDGHQILIDYQNIETCMVNFYITDLEVLYSAHPFQESNTGYKLVTPNESLELKLDTSETQVQVKLPAELKENNTIIQILAGKLEVVDLYNDNKLDVQLAEAEGELRVLNKNTGRPIEGAYCKVYAQSRVTGKEEFFKDGYTDLRGRYNYRTLSTDQLRQSTRLSILITKEKLGSLIKEVDVPLDFVSQAKLF